HAVLFATNSIELKEKVSVLSGDVIVNRVGQGGGPDLSLKEKVKTAVGYSLKASRIDIKENAVINSNVYYNTLKNKGSIIGTLFTPLALPVVASLPPFLTSTPGNQDVTVSENGSLTLAPGSYRDVKVKEKGTLTCSGGTYHFRNLTLKEKTKIRFVAAGEVRILNSFDAGEKSYIGPAQGSPIDASDIIFYVGGSGKSITLGGNADIFANFYAPLGEIEVKEKTNVTGSLLGKDITVKENCQLTFAGTFAGLSKSSVTSWNQEPDGSSSESLPTVFALSQNYPNPFNPVTTIRYQLPSQRDVSLHVYNVLGQVVRTLVQETQPAGTYSIEWNGLNDVGTSVGSGIFFYHIKAGDFTDTKKMILLK
ncbi:MAG: T9SS type A sorting domain-containing protein, partial [bacterium]